MNLILQKRLAAAQGKIECDLILKNAQYLDVFQLKWKKGDIAICDGVIVGLEAGLRAKRVIDVKNKYLAPGFIDAHVHVESSMMIPHAFERSVLPKGTTSAICDPHELANVAGKNGIAYFLEAAPLLNLKLHVMLSSCVPATHLETNGGGTLSAKDLLEFKNHSHALGLAEIMNVPGVLHGDEAMLEKITSFHDRPLDGHAPLLRGQALSAYAACGISSCHESSEHSEAEEKLSKGISVWIREGSVAKDLNELVSLLSVETSMAMGFCTDDRNPLDIAEEGHVDYLVRSAIRKGIDPKIALRAASLSVANHYGLNRGFSKVGAIAPGYAADLVTIEDLGTLALSQVYQNGIRIEELTFSKPLSFSKGNSIRATTPTAKDLEGVKGNVHVMEVIPGKIITGRSVGSHSQKGIAHISVLERYGNGQKPANAYVKGFGENLSGAIGSSVGHDSHNLIVVGSDTESMVTCFHALIEQGGGFVVSKGSDCLYSLALPVGGLMSEQDPNYLKEALMKLKEASRSIGCELNDPFLQLAFLSLPVIPSLKLTNKGLVDVDRFEIISVTA